MVVQRASVLSRGLGRSVLRQATAPARSRGWRQLGRRTYASGHGEQQSSELPWIIGSLAVTVPAAGWLLQQGPTKSDHGHGHGGHDDEHKEEAEAKENDGEQEGSQDEEAPEESKDESSGASESEGEGEEKGGDDGKQEDEDKGEEKAEESTDEGKDDYPPPSPGSPGQINWKPGMNKGPGEGQKGERKPSERKGEKDSQGTHSGAKHPYIDDAEKSKKGLGVTETAKIHGTVDPNHNARGPNTGKSE